MQVLQWIFSDHFEPFYADACQFVGRTANFCYVHEVSDECYHDHEGLLLREPLDVPLVIGLRCDLSVHIAELTAAHELTHERLILAGYPLVRSELAMLLPLASAYSSVLGDPMIDHVLLASGYDVRPLLARDLDQLTRHVFHPQADCIPFSDPEDEVEFLRFLRLALSPLSAEIHRPLRPCMKIRNLVESFRSAVLKLQYETPMGQRRALDFLLQYSSAKSLLHVFSPLDSDNVNSR